MFKKFGLGAVSLLIALMPVLGFVGRAAALTTGANLVANSSFETSASGTAPDAWLYGNWGTNTSTSTYLNTGHTGGHSVEVQTTAFTNGAANWYYTDAAVTAGQTYEYSNWYQSNVDTEVDAEVVMTDGTTQYFNLGTALTSADWAQFKTTFQPPAGAKSFAVYQVLAKVGFVISDDYSLSTYTSTPFNRPIISVTFDDGWENQFQNAAPVMTQVGLIGTYYIISGPSVTALDPLYMNSDQVKALYAAGNEIGSHSITHPDLTTLSPTNLTTEMQQSQATLQNLIGVPVTDFAYPFGAYNGATLAEGLKYYASQRTVSAGYNTKDNFNPTLLKMYEVDSNISQAQVQGWVDGAIAQNAWLILCYHEVATTPADPSDALYTTNPVDFAAEMNYIKSKNVAVETVNNALHETQAQIGTVTPPATKPGDINGDNVVDALDLSTVLSNWNKSGQTAAQGDLNADGTVDALDLSLVLANWSK